VILLVFHSKRYILIGVEPLIPRIFIHSSLDLREIFFFQELMDAATQITQDSQVENVSRDNSDFAHVT